MKSLKKAWNTFREATLSNCAFGAMLYWMLFVTNFYPGFKSHGFSWWLFGNAMLCTSFALWQVRRKIPAIIRLLKAGSYILYTRPENTLQGKVDANAIVADAQSLINWCDDAISDVIDGEAAVSEVNRILHN